MYLSDVRWLLSSTLWRCWWSRFALCRVSRSSEADVWQNADDVSDLLINYFFLSVAGNVVVLLCVCSCAGSVPTYDTMNRFPRASAPPRHIDWWRSRFRFWLLKGTGPLKTPTIWLCFHHSLRPVLPSSFLCLIFHVYFLTLLTRLQLVFVLFCSMKPTVVRIIDVSKRAAPDCQCALEEFLKRHIVLKKL